MGKDEGVGAGRQAWLGGQGPWGPELGEGE